MDNRQHSTLAGAGSGEVVERLLPNFRTRNALNATIPTITKYAIYRARINAELAVRVVRVITHTLATSQKQTLNTPIAVLHGSESPPRSSA